MDRINDLLSQESVSYDELMELRELGYNGNIRVRLSSIINTDFEGTMTMYYEAFDNLLSDENVTLLLLD